MKITRKNYESYFLDYLEGLLDPSLMEEMSEFIRQNPDLNAELEDFDSLQLQADTIQFKEKDQLKKLPVSSRIIHDQNFDQVCIAKLEGDLSSVEEKALNQFLVEHPAREKEFKIFQKTKLQPQPVIFPDKSRLKRKAPVFWIKLPRYAISAAASILIIVVFSFIFIKLRAPQNEQIVENPPATEEKTDEAAVESKVASQENEIESELIQEIEEKKSEANTEEQLSVPVIAMNSTEPAEEQPVLLTKTSSQEVENDRSRMLPLAMIEIKKLNNPSGVVNNAMAMVNEAEKSPENYLTIRELIVSRIKREPSQSQVPGEEKEKLTFLDVADAGVRGISKIPGVNMKIDRTYNENGELKSYAFTSRNLYFTRDVKNKVSL